MNISTHRFLWFCMLMLVGCQGELNKTESHTTNVSKYAPPSVNHSDMSANSGLMDMAMVESIDLSMSDMSKINDMRSPEMGMDMSAPEPAVPSDQGLKRLSDQQYRNTVIATISAIRGEEPNYDVTRMMAQLSTSPELSSRLDGVPPMGVYTRVAIAAANQLVERGPVREILRGDDNQARQAALSLWLQAQGHHFLRRPLTQNEIAYYVDITQNNVDEKALRHVITALFLSPYFLFRIEHGMEQAPDLPKVDLTAWELASRLSYFLWRSAPDEALYDAARDGSLVQEQVLVEHVQRMLNDPKSDAFLLELAIQWLGIKTERLDFFAVSSFDRFMLTFFREDHATWDHNQRSTYFDGGRDNVSLREAMEDDITAFMRYVIVTQKGSLEELFTTSVATARDPRISVFYGVEQWDGMGLPPSHAPERGGILGRVLFLADAAENTHPILRGLHIREHVLCGEHKVVPMDFVFKAPPSPPFSTRDMVDFTTGPDNISCWGCHQDMNGLGFALENYDVFGRYRDTEFYFLSTDERQEIARNDSRYSTWQDVPLGLPVEVNGVSFPRLDRGDDVTQVQNPAELAQLIVDWQPNPAQERNGNPILDAHQCFAKHLESFGYDGALVSDEDHQLLIAKIRQGSIDEAITALVTSPSFVSRQFGHTLLTQENP